MGNDADQTTVYQPCERRFRTSSYFLEDQLKCSEALSDFRSIRTMIQKSQAFCQPQAFRFQFQQVPVKGR